MGFFKDEQTAAHLARLDAAVASLQRQIDVHDKDVQRALNASAGLDIEAGRSSTYRHFGCPPDTISLPSAVYAILRHLGLEFRKTPEKTELVSTKPAAPLEPWEEDPIGYCLNEIRAKKTKKRK